MEPIPKVTEHPADTELPPKVTAGITANTQCDYTSSSHGTDTQSDCTSTSHAADTQSDMTSDTELPPKVTAHLTAMKPIPKVTLFTNSQLTS